MSELGLAFDELEADENIGCIVLTGSDKAFAAGADIKEMSAYGPDEARAFGELGSGVCDAIESIPSITIAVLQGAALGGGFEISLACDFRIAVAAVKMGLPETMLGLLPGWGGIPRTMGLIGQARAKRLIFSGAPVSAEKAARIGLIDEVVDDAAGLNDAIKRMCDSFSKGSPAAIALVKRSLREGRFVDAFTDCFAGPESREGMTAFAEKRPANWITR